MGNKLTADMALDIRIIRTQNDQMQRDMAALRLENEKLQHEVKSLRGKLSDQSEQVWALHKKLGEVEQKYKRVLMEKENLLELLRSGGRLDEVGVSELAEQQALLEDQFEEIRAMISATKKELDVKVDQRSQKGSTSPSRRSRVYEKDEVEEATEYNARSSSPSSCSSVEAKLMDREADVRLRWKDYSSHKPSGKMTRLRSLATIISELLTVLASAQEKLGKGSAICKRLQNLREEIEDEGREVSRS